MAESGRQGREGTRAAMPPWGELVRWGFAVLMGLYHARKSSRVACQWYVCHYLYNSAPPMMMMMIYQSINQSLIAQGAKLGQLLQV